MDIEQQLRAALAPREPRPGFEDRVMARLKVGKPVSSGNRWRVAAALAATVLAVAFGLQWHMQQQRQRQAEAQLLLALEITSSKLNRVQQKLVRPDIASYQENGS